MPLFFLSGALFPLSDVPLALQVAARIDSLSYGVDALRFALLRESHFGFSLDMAILIVSCTAMLGIGARLFQRIEV